MIRTTIAILVLLIGCAPYRPGHEPIPPYPESQFVGEYATLIGKFRADYPNLTELSGSYHGDYFKYITPDGKILRARKNSKRGVWNIYVRQPHQSDVKEIMERIETGYWPKD